MEKLLERYGAGETPLDTCGREQQDEEKRMTQTERLEILVLGSGVGGKLIAWHMAQSGRRTAVVERRWVGGSCPNIACMPSKNEIASAKVAHLARDGWAPFHHIAATTRRC